MDVYPTLAALAGLPDPVSKGEHLNGTSMVPLFEDPRASIKKAAFSQFAKCGEQCPNPGGSKPKPESEWKGPHNWYDIGPHYSRKQTTVMGVRRLLFLRPIDVLFLLHRVHRSSDLSMSMSIEAMIAVRSQRLIAAMTMALCRELHGSAPTTARAPAPHRSSESRP